VFHNIITLPLTKHVSIYFPDKYSLQIHNLSLEMAIHFQVSLMWVVNTNVYIQFPFIADIHWIHTDGIQLYLNVPSNVLGYGLGVVLMLFHEGVVSLAAENELNVYMCGNRQMLQRNMTTW